MKSRIYTIENLLLVIIVTIISNYLFVLTGPLMIGLIFTSIIIGSLFFPVLNIYSSIQPIKKIGGLFYSLLFASLVLLTTIILSNLYRKSSNYNVINMEGSILSIVSIIIIFTMVLSSIICFVKDAYYNISMNKVKKIKIFLRSVILYLIIITLSYVYSFLLSIIGMFMYWS